MQNATKTQKHKTRNANTQHAPKMKKQETAKCINEKQTRRIAKLENVNKSVDRKPVSVKVKDKSYGLILN